MTGQPGVRPELTKTLGIPIAEAAVSATIKTLKRSEILLKVGSDKNVCLLRKCFVA
jgi:hypothetical protein